MQIGDKVKVKASCRVGRNNIGIITRRSEVSPNHWVVDFGENNSPYVYAFMEESMEVLSE